ncbi:MAG: hypothetical protein AB1714_20690 [Acidobacteriota bacterium]
MRTQVSFVMALLLSSALATASTAGWMSQQIVVSEGGLAIILTQTCDFKDPDQTTIHHSARCIDLMGGVVWEKKLEDLNDYSVYSAHIDGNQLVIASGSGVVWPTLSRDDRDPNTDFKVVGLNSLTGEPLRSVTIQGYLIDAKPSSIGVEYVQYGEMKSDKTLYHLAAILRTGEVLWDMVTGEQGLGAPPGRRGAAALGSDARPGTQSNSDSGPTSGSR